MQWLDELGQWAKLAKQKVFIYALIDPRDGAVRYIGKANDPRKRFLSHLQDAKRRKTPVYSWIRKLEKAGLKPGLFTLVVCNGHTWKEAERSLIAKYRSVHSRLLNVADGGDEPFCPREVRAANGRKVALARFEKHREIAAEYHSLYAQGKSNG